MSSFRVALLVVACVLASPRIASAQFICANFFSPVTGTYGDLCPVTVTGSNGTATEHGLTGFDLATPAGQHCVTFAMGQRVGRIDMQLVGLDPTEEVWVLVNGVEVVMTASNVITTPDLTAQAVTIVGGRLRSTGSDGSAALEFNDPNLTGFAICGSSAGTTGGVVLRTIIQSLCQCANGNKHFNEDCDDGGMVSGDGCSATCEIEPGYYCVGNPSVCDLIPDAGPPDATPIDAPDIDAAPPIDAAPDIDAAPPIDAPMIDAAPPAPIDAPSPDADPGAPDGDPGPDAEDNDLSPIERPGCCSGSGSPGGALLALGVLAALVVRIRPRARRSTRARRSSRRP